MKKTNNGACARQGTDALFLYANKFTGHEHAANAIGEALHQLEPTITTSYVDSLYSYPFLGPLISQIYLKVIRTVPQVWDYVYDNPKIKQATEEIRNLFSALSISNIKKILKKYQPNVLVCTHCVPASAIAFLKKQNGLSKPLVGIITDHAIHSYWFNKEIDLYLVPNEDIQTKLVVNGIRRSKIKVTGIPIDLSFTKNINKKVSRKHFGLNAEMFTVLIMAGSLGLAPLPEILDNLTQTNSHIQYLVITGRNKKLLHQLKKEYSREKKFHIFGYIKNIHLAMESADIMVTKPGGLTISESLTKSLPMIVVQPLPGQEKRNVQYLLKHRLAERCDDIDRLAHQVESFCDKPDKIRSYSNHMYNFAKPHAAYNCAQSIIDLIDK